MMTSRVHSDDVEHVLANVDAEYGCFSGFVTNAHDDPPFFVRLPYVGWKDEADHLIKASACRHY
ncbi:hypothetical protein O206_21325 [Ochrobactrum sp. EGD-AQ16]|nr:hypothetical protein O206_21325 [Ochrobactrum sp. EGD-AQ16]